jgi:phosphatidylinositol glycan class B
MVKKIILLIAIVWYIVTAFNSNGFYHPDEHFQILEFANFKSNDSPVEDLSWEYQAKIRPTMQIWLAYSLFNVLKFFGAYNPFFAAFILRLITGMLSITAIYLFCKNTATYFKVKDLNLYLVISLFLWFVPFISVRYSSETWSGLFLILAISQYFGNRKNAVSVCFADSIHVRYFVL